MAAATFGSSHGLPANGFAWSRKLNHPRPPIASGGVGSEGEEEGGANRQRPARSTGSPGDASARHRPLPGAVRRSGRPRIRRTTNSGMPSQRPPARHRAQVVRKTLGHEVPEREPRKRGIGGQTRHAVSLRFGMVNNVLRPMPGSPRIMRKRIRILHRTAYYYHQPVTFGPHRAMLRPREGHDVHIVKGAIRDRAQGRGAMAARRPRQFDRRDHLLRAVRPARGRERGRCRVSLRQSDRMPDRSGRALFPVSICTRRAARIDVLPAAELSL